MSEKSITELGNPGKPQGEAGIIMLNRMSVSHKNVTDWAFSHLNITGNEAVLEIGCGSGIALKKVAGFIDSGNLAGIDHSEISVELSKNNNSDDIKSGKTQIIQSSVENLPFDDDSFDIIYTVESFYFWNNPLECLKEVRRVLAPGGIFMIAADIYGDAELTDEEIENVRKYNLFNPTRDQFRELLERSGFSEIKINTCPGTNWICTIAVK